MSRKNLVLVVEDDPTLSWIIQAALEEIGGYDVVSFPTGEGALAALAALQPDLLILDVALPGLDGPQTLEAMRALDGSRSTPAIFLTSHTRASDMTRYQALAVADVVAKPFLPHLLCERVAKVLAGAAAQPGFATPGRTALVVEDDPGIRFLLAMVLRQHGWLVVDAHDADQALQRLEQGLRPEVVLLDIVLPGPSDGMDLLAKLRNRPGWDGVTIIMLTGRHDESTISRALALGANDYLGKPFDPIDLVSRLPIMKPG